MLRIARKHELIIFLMRFMTVWVFDGAVHIPIATLAPDLFVVTMNGLSKSHRICGFRVGWMVLSGPKHHVKGGISKA